MKKYNFTARIVALSLLTFLIAGALVTRLADLQLVNGADIAASVTDNTVRKYTEVASRGELLDRNGVKLTSNGLGFSLQLDYYNWDKSRQNEVLLELALRLKAAGIDTNDNLPVSFDQPYTYTYPSAESGVGLKLAKFIAAQKDWPEAPTANRLLGLLAQKYGVDADLGMEELRLVVGLRYYLESCEFSGYNTPVSLAGNLDIDTVAVFSEEAAQLPGVTVQVDDVREYNTPYAAHVLGRVSSISAEEYAEKKEQGYSMTDNIGKDGMEQALEEYLRGIDGTYAVEYDKTGAVADRYYLEEPDPGNDCFLTLDINLQKVAEEALAATLDDLRKNKDPGEGGDAEGGCAVVIDVKTGEVLCMASYPTFDLSNFSADFQANNSDPLAPLFNRCISATYSPGSTFKMCTSVAALQEKIITPSTKIRDEGVYKYYDTYQPRCWLYRQYGRTHGLINVSQALKYSCNYFYYEMGRRLGDETLAKYAASFGLGEKTGVELRNEKAGHMASSAYRKETGGATWYPADTLMAAIGQSDSQFTPLQLANYVATLVNGGIRYQPHLLKKVADNTGTEVLEGTEPSILGTVEMSASTVKAVKEGMRGVVTEDGTASSHFRNYPIAVGGKTGSAQNTNGRSAHALFVSFAPYDDPQIAVCIVGEYASSGGNMAPVCLEIYNQYFGLNQAQDTTQEPGADTENGAQADAQTEQPGAQN